ncbi:MAG: hypothetical protein AAGH76_12670 [Pseudomonadota bacterium]
MARTTDKPERPYLGSAQADALARTNTELMSELWILRDRVLVLEHILAEAGLITAGAVGDYEPDAALTEALQTDRDQFVARIAGAAHRDTLDLAAIRASTAPKKR